MPKSTGYRKINLAQTKRKILFDQDDDSVEYLWSSVKKRKPYSKISLELRSKVIEWLKKHPHIIQSPNFNDTLIVKDKSNNGLCIREQKYLHQISIRERHNDLLSKHPIGLSEVYDKEGNPLISDTAFRSLLPRNFQPMSNKYKQMCGCEICIVIKSLQSDLNQYRLSHLHRLEKSKIDSVRTKEYRQTIYKNNKHIHSHPKEALLTIQCPPVFGFQVPHMKFILRRCKDCAKYRYFDEEKNLNDHDPPISFHFFQKVSKCSLHGIINNNTEFCPKCNNDFNIKKKVHLATENIWCY